MQPQDVSSIIACIGVTGEKAAGKDTLSKRVATVFGFQFYRMSDIIRAEGARRGMLDMTVEQLQDLGDEMRKGSIKGEDLLTYGMLRWALEKGATRLLINGMRNPNEIDTLERLFGERFLALSVDAPIEKRIDWFFARGQAGDPKEGLMNFLRVDARDRGVGQPPHGQHVGRTMARVPPERTYHNGGTLEEFNSWTDAQVAQHMSRVQPLVSMT